MSVIQEIVEDIEKLSMVELLELKESLVERLGIIMPQTNFVFSELPSPGELAPQKQTEFSLNLINAGNTKIAIIKLVREILAFDLKSSKDLVDAVPKIIKNGLSWDEAEALKSRFISAGAEASIIWNIENVSSVVLSLLFGIGYTVRFGELGLGIFLWLEDFHFLDGNSGSFLVGGPMNAGIVEEAVVLLFSKLEMVFHMKN